ncbi:MAG: TonB-dependent receptor [Proteobacteria bacterium]|nr:TonB-dependent receptor [Pseudomonadota bacterium]
MTELLRTLRHRSTALDIQLLLGRQLLGLLWGGGALVGSFWLASHGVRWLDAAFGRPTTPTLDVFWVGLLYSAVLFVAWDASRFVVHWLMHRVPALWAIHQLHHSAEVLTPLTFHRLHPLESVLYQLRSAGVTAAIAGLFFWVFREQAQVFSLLGVHAAGFVLNAVFGNLRHSHVWLRFGRVERWLISPAQHQMHHAVDPALQQSNYGTWLAIWDRMAGTLRLAGAEPVTEFGLAEAERNHGDDLVSAWLGPLRDALRSFAPALTLFAAMTASAQEPVDPEDEPAPTEDDWASYGEDILVYAPDGTPRVAGSAHQIGEDVLEQYQHDDIERTMAAVPGVTTRGEDGYGLRPNIGIRGVNSDRSAKITLLEDGVPLVPAPYAAPAAYYFPMAARLVGVEVFKGPAATTHGPHTVGGAINLRTREVPDETTGALDVAAGLRGTARLHGWVGTGNGDHGALLEAVRLETGGFKTLDGGGPTGFERNELMFKGRLGTSGEAASHAVELKLGYASEVSHETYLGLSPSDYAATPYRRYAASQNGEMGWHRTQTELSWSAQVADFKFRTVAYHHWLSRQWTKFNRFAGGPDVHALLQADPTAGTAGAYMAILRGEADTETAEQALQIGTNDRRYHSAGIQSTGQWDVRGEKVDSTLRFGLRLHGDQVDRRHTEEAFAMTSGSLVDMGGDTDVLLDSRDVALAIAAHVQEEVAIGPVHVLPGARVEAIRTQRVDEKAVDRVAVLPGLGALVELGTHAQIYAGGHRGFSPVAPGQPIEVRPEVSWNYELGARVGDAERHAELTGFVNDYVNLTGQCTISGGCVGEMVDQQFNGGRAWVAGLEGVAGHRWLLPGGLELPIDATYTFTHSRFRTSFVSGFPQFGAVTAGDSLPYVPGHSGSARVSLEHDLFRLGVGTTARTGMRDRAGSEALGDGDVPALFLLDAAAEVRVSPLLRVYATGSNLTGSKAVTSWRPFGARPTAPTQVMVGIKLEPAP